MKKLIVVLAIFVFTSSFSQYKNATLFLKDGKVIEGMAKVGNLGTVLFKKDKKAKKNLYDHKELDSIILEENYTDIQYHYKKIKTEDQPKLLRVLHKGNILLYGQFKKENVSNDWDFGYKYNIKGMYVAKELNDSVTFLGSSDILQKKFRENAIDYFNDCSSLVEKISNKEFKLRNIKNIVKFYDENCSKE